MSGLYVLRRSDGRFLALDPTRTSMLFGHWWERDLYCASPRARPVLEEYARRRLPTVGYELLEVVVVRGRCRFVRGETLVA